MVERIPRDQIKKGMMLVSGPPSDLSLTKVNVVMAVEDVEAIDAEFERQLAERAREQRKLQ